MAHTEEELALLTEEERAGLEDPDLQDDEQEEDEDGDADTGAADEGDDEAGADDDAAGADADAAADEAGRDDGADDEQEDTRQPLPQITTEAPADAEAKLADIDKREDELSEKFEDGDVTTSEYRAELRKLERERSGIEKAQMEHALASKFNEAQAQAMWERDVQQFLGENPEVGTSQLRMDSFDIVVRRITAESMKEGKLPGMADLKKAHAEWTEQLGIAPKVEPKKEEGKPAAKPAAKADEPAKKRPALPPSLASVPSAQINDTDDGKWAGLDRLMDTDPMGFEKALAKMSESDRDAYLAAS